jgi:hypothetical protein
MAIPAWHTAGIAILYIQPFKDKEQRKKRKGFFLVFRNSFAIFAKINME